MVSDCSFHETSTGTLALLFRLTGTFGAKEPSPFKASLYPFKIISKSCPGCASAKVSGMVSWNAANAASTRFFKDPMSWRSPLKDRRRVSKVASCDVWISVLIVSSASSSCCIRPSVAFTASVLYCVQRDWMTAATAFSMSRPQHVHSSLLSLNFAVVAMICRALAAVL